MTNATTPRGKEQVQYGNLRRVRLPGLGRLSAAASVILLVGALGLMVLMILSLVVAIAWAILIAAIITPEFIPSRDGYSRYAKMLRWIRHRGTERSGQALLRQGLTGHVPDGQCRPPGVAAAIELSTHHDIHGREFGLVCWPKADLYAVAIQTFPAGFSGLDQDVIDLEVAHWAAWLGQLNTIGEVVGAAVVIETAPDSGQRLARSVARGRVDDAPSFSKQLVAELLDNRRSSSPSVSTRITITFSAKSPDESEPYTRQEMAEAIGDVLPTLTGTLDETGAGTGSYPCSTQELTDLTRVAYDPGVAALVEEAQFAGGTGLTWDQAGPIAAHNAYDRYYHEGAVSRTWQMREAPRGLFFAQTLQRLLGPHRDVARKRVAILYRPESPERSAVLAENDVKAARFLATQKKHAAAGARLAEEAAQQSAKQEAMGSPLIRVGLLVTVTVLDEALLKRASRAIVSALAPQARLRMRVAKGAQDSSFVAGLPLGMVPPANLALPAAVRDAA